MGGCFMIGKSSDFAKHDVTATRRTHYLCTSIKRPRSHMTHVPFSPVVSCRTECRQWDVTDFRDLYCLYMPESAVEKVRLYESFDSERRHERRVIGHRVHNEVLKNGNSTMSGLFSVMKRAWSKFKKYKQDLQLFEHSAHFPQLNCFVSSKKL